TPSAAPAEAVAVSEPPLDVDATEILPDSIPAPPPAPVPEAPPVAAAPPEAPPVAAAPAERAFVTSIPPRPRAESVDQSIRDENVKLAERVRDLEKDLREARARSTELEDQAQRGAAKDAEVQRLQRELDDAKAKAATAGAAGGKGAGSAREF